MWCEADEGARCKPGRPAGRLLQEPRQEMMELGLKEQVEMDTSEEMRGLFFKI